MYNILIFVTVLSVAKSEITVPGIDRTVTDGIQSKGYKIVYGDQDITILNEAVSEMEKNDILQKQINLQEAIKPLAAEDVKCLMSVDRYCSSDMRHIKGLLIQAIKDDCEKCTNDDKDNAGKVAASMMAHDPVAWKLFLTRCALHIKPEIKESKPENFKYKLVGEPEIVSSKNRYTKPGIKVRVKRYNAEKIP